MGRRNPKIKTGAPPQPERRIRVRPPEQPPKLAFSFQYLDDQTRQFAFRDNGPAYFLALLDRLKAACHLTPDELRGQASKAWRCHPIEWKQTTMDGFPSPLNRAEDIEPYQFSISSNEHGRVHGAFVEHVFYVVWLDVGHELYAGGK